MPPPPIAAYDPSRVIQTFGTITPVAYGPGTRLSITPTGPNFSVMQGQDGHVIRVKTRAIHHNLNFELMKSDPANDLLQELYAKDVDSLTPAGIVKYTLTDNNGTTKASAAYAWIAQVPDVTYSAGGDLYIWNVTLISAEVQPRAMTFIP